MAPMPEKSITDAELALLRAYEPVVRYTKGELFLPTAVGPYVEQCSLWSGLRGNDSTLLVPARELTIERLSQEGLACQDRPLYLRFVEEPLGRAEYLRWLRIPRERLSATGRFTTTGTSAGAGTTPSSSARVSDRWRSPRPAHIRARSSRATTWSRWILRRCERCCGSCAGSSACWRRGATTRARHPGWASRSSTTPAATAWPSAPGTTRNGLRS